MGNIIWIWRFPNSWRKQSEVLDEKIILDIDQGVYGDNVVLFSPKSDDNELFPEEKLDLREKIIALVETIINLWVQDYMASIPQDIPSRDPFSDVVDMYGKMYDEALTVVETLDYVDKIYWEDFDEEFKIQALGDVLYRYRKSVFCLLKRNEKRKGS